MKSYLYVFATIIFTVYGQIVLKWRLNTFGSLPLGAADKIKFLLRSFLDPFVFSAFCSAFVASFFWMTAMTKLEITKAYPFMSLAPVLVFLFGVFFLGEAFTIGKVIGLLLIILGILITVKY